MKDQGTSILKPDFTMAILDLLGTKRRKVNVLIRRHGRHLQTKSLLINITKAL